MNILYGVCGFGNGHSARSAVVLEGLLQRGHRVAVMGFLNSQRYFSEHFPQLPLFPLQVPVVHVGREGVDFGRSADEPFNRFEDGHALNFRAMQATLDYFGGKPDLVVSDYELVCAQFAYALDLPLVTLDQQSKFAGFQFPEVNTYHRLEEKSRLSMFFPVAERRIACSFFQVPWERDPRFEVDLIPPLLRPEILATNPQTWSSDAPIVVYFSPHFSTEQTPEEIYTVLQGFPERQFIIYNRDTRPPTGNLIFRRFDKQGFIADLGRAAAVLTTAGHNLLSEITYLKKPIYTLPFPTFDQQCCADVIERQAWGRGLERVTGATFGAFLQNLPEYHHNLMTTEALLSPREALSEVFGILGL